MIRGHRDLDPVLRRDFPQPPHDARVVDQYVQRCARGQEGPRRLPHGRERRQVEMEGSQPPVVPAPVPAPVDAVGVDGAHCLRRARFRTAPEYHGGAPLVQLSRRFESDAGTVVVVVVFFHPRRKVCEHGVDFAMREYYMRDKKWRRIHRSKTGGAGGKGECRSWHRNATTRHRRGRNRIYHWQYLLTWPR